VDELVIIVVVLGVAAWLIWWIVSNIFSSIIEAGQNFQSSRKRRRDALQKWGVRPKDTRTLEERNEDIIRSHLESFHINGSRRYHESDAIRDCIQDIADAEGRSSEGPNRTFLWKWNQTATPEFLALSTSLSRRFGERSRELSQAKQKQEQLEIEAKMRTLQGKYAPLIRAFYEVAERKVSLLDDYGEENWGALQREIDLVIQKIATKENAVDYSRWKKFPWAMPNEYKQLSDSLDQSFRVRHQKARFERVPKVDYRAMTGVDFEVYLTKLLERLGFTNIRGTAATGDQGADILARKDGRNIVIQAKRYMSPVGNGAVQEALSALHFYSGDEGWVVTNSTFTQSAKELAQRTGIRLIDGHELSGLSRD
jgi:hypothetical protein